MLEVSYLNTFYGKIQALWDISLRIEEAEIVALVGANGAGKTTLLNTVTGLLRPASGTVKFLGKRIEGLDSHEIVELGISHIPEGRKLFPDMTVRENLEMCLSESRMEAERGNDGAGLCAFSHIKDPAEPNRRHLERRRTTDGGNGSWPDVKAETVRDR